MSEGRISGSDYYNKRHRKMSRVMIRGCSDTLSICVIDYQKGGECGNTSTFTAVKSVPEKAMVCNKFKSPTGNYPRSYLKLLSKEVLIIATKDDRLGLGEETLTEGTLRFFFMMNYTCR